MEAPVKRDPKRLARVKSRRSRSMASKLQPVKNAFTRRAPVRVVSQIGDSEKRVAVRLALVKSAPSSLALWKLALRRSARQKSAPLRFAPMNLARRREAQRSLARLRQAWVKSAESARASERSAAVKSALVAWTDERRLARRSAEA